VSVAALVTLKPDAQPPEGLPVAGYLPVATESEFYRYWLPIATRCDLDVVAAMGHGISLGPADLTEADAQLARLAAEVPVLPAAVAARIVDRVRLLRELLALLDGGAVEEIYVG